MTEAPKTPEIDKLNAEAARHRMAGDFIEWMQENGFTICETVEQKPGAWGQNPYLPTRLSTEQMLAKYLEVDMDKVEDERRMYLDWHRVRSAEIEAGVEQQIDQAAERAS